MAEQIDSPWLAITKTLDKPHKYLLGLSYGGVVLSLAAIGCYAFLLWALANK